MTITTTLRAAIKSDKRTLYRIALDSGVSQSILSRFMAGHDITLATASKLASVLDLELREPIVQR